LPTSNAYRFYKRDKSQVTAKEKAAARVKRDEMLATSQENASRQLAGKLVPESVEKSNVSTEVKETNENMSACMICQAE
jgi:hypothetical protein